LGGDLRRAALLGNAGVRQGNRAPRRHAELPENAVVLYSLACAESLSGRRDDALAHLEQAIKLNPPFRKAAQTDADFDPIRGDPEFPAPE